MCNTVRRFYGPKIAYLFGMIRFQRAAFLTAISLLGSILATTPAMSQAKKAKNKVEVKTPSARERWKVLQEQKSKKPVSYTDGTNSIVIEGASNEEAADAADILIQTTSSEPLIGDEKFHFAELSEGSEVQTDTTEALDSREDQSESVDGSSEQEQSER